MTVETDVTREDTPRGNNGNKSSSSLSAGQINAGSRMACGSADAAIPEPRERKCSG